MTISPAERDAVTARDVHLTGDLLTVELNDGRSLAIPLAWYPRLSHGTASERAHWRLTGGGRGIHWPDLDEDLNVEDLLAGRRSGETAESVTRWLHERTGR